MARTHSSSGVSTRTTRGMGPVRLNGNVRTGDAQTGAPPHHRARHLGGDPPARHERRAGRLVHRARQRGAVYATDLAPGEQVTLLDGSGATVAARPANELGGALFRD